MVHTFQQQDHAAESVELILNQAVRARRQGLIWNSMIAPIVQSLTVIGVALFLGLGYLLVQQAEASVEAIPRMITFVFILYRLLPRITALNASLAGLNSNWPFANRIANLLNSHDKQYTLTGAQTFNDLGDKIDFQAVTLTYPESDQPAIEKLSLIIPRGSMTAFVGTSGAGKSTLVNLLLRLYEPTDGQILVDEVKLSDYQLETWRNQIGVVDQDTFVFNRSIADNIRFGKLDATQAEIEEAAHIAHAHDFILALPDGYETVVGDRGYRLSGGQRQRIAIARSILRDPAILIFDEATSALDSQSERLIQQALEMLRQDRTLIVIAHRLSTIAQADQIFVLSEGTLLEQGTHGELLAVEGHYRSMWRLQVQE